MGNRVDVHVPIARLPDGTPLHAPLGRITAVDARNRVKCHARGALLAHIAAHLCRHGVAVTGDRSRYELPGGTSLTAPGTAAAKVVEGRVRAHGAHRAQGTAAGRVPPGGEKPPSGWRRSCLAGRRSPRGTCDQRHTKRSPISFGMS